MGSCVLRVLTDTPFSYFVFAFMFVMNCHLQFLDITFPLSIFSACSTGL